ncbi:MAG TPA: chemotaxis protein CheB [Candidatus Sulfomarinibacteraceae bacterium]|nr:chemotaxis protein CheB [Candidatus Sulfomarinibacteraceae bacterium]
MDDDSAGRPGLRAGGAKGLEARPVVVALGSSAGGLKVLTRFFEVMPADSGMAFIVVQHLDPCHASLTAELLARRTKMPVAEAEDGAEVVADRVYVIPPDRRLTVERGKLRVRPRESGDRVAAGIDHLMRSLAVDSGERAVGVVLSGSGSDGTVGLREIKARGGMTVAQDPATAEHAGMPSSAIATGVVDQVADVEEIPNLLVAYARHPYVAGISTAAATADEEQRPFREILAVLRARTGYDFRRYKQNMLQRRIQRRMGLSRVDRIEEYLEFLRSRPDEIGRLFEDLLISVTGFFREPEAYRVLADVVVPAIVDGVGDEAPIRCWVPGCATGEEAYSLAMVFLEHLRKKRLANPLQIFASDVDQGALKRARLGIYPESIAADLPAGFLERYFACGDGHLTVVPPLRDAVIFARHNLVSDPPFSRLNLVSCRNLLIYLEQRIQSSLLELFHFALVDDGYLFLGSSETVSSHPELFEPVSKKWRLFRRIGVTRSGTLDFLRTSAQAGATALTEEALGAAEGPLDLGGVTRRLLLAEHTPAAVLVNRASEVLFYHGDTGRYLSHPVGEPTADLSALVRDTLGGRVRAAVRRAIHEAKPVVVSGTRLGSDGTSSQVRITVSPVTQPRGAEGLLLVTFEGEPALEAVVDPPDSTADDALVHELALELKATREELQATIEELESSNEELKASNEEVMSVNEELQSANEELETSKEELQSLNEELATVNSQLRAKVEDFESANNDLANLLRSSDVGTLFLDRELRVKLFTEPMLALFSLRPGDAGRPIADLAPKFSDPKLPDDAREVLRRLVPISKEVRSEDGRWHLRRVVPYRTRDDRIEGVVVTFTDVTELKHTLRAFSRQGLLIDLLHEVAVAANNAATVEEAVGEILPRVARFLGAVHGQFWLVDEGNADWFERRGPRFDADPRRAASLEVAEDRLRREAAPLIRDAMEAARPRWSDDVENAVGEARGAAVAGADVAYALAVPILAGDRALGVLELFVDDLRVPDDQLSVLAASIGGGLGGAIERVGLHRKLSDLGEEEQRRIGKELHDTVAQEITGLRLLAETLRRRLEPATPEHDMVERMVETAGEAQSHVRSLARGLVPVVIAAAGLRAAVENLLERMRVEHGLRCELVNPGGVVVDDSQLATNLYYIVQEAVRNAILHGEARHVTVELSQNGRTLGLRVVDDGAGFNPDEVTAVCGSGLRIMSYRARIVGGRVDIASEPGSGTTVTCTVER